MDIFGVGGVELVLILLIMVIVAGPKRMISWSYQLGRYIAIIRNMWAETAKQLQKELDASGVDVQIPQDLPTRQNISKEIGRIAAPITKPLDETMQNLKVTADDIRRPLAAPQTPAAAPATTPPPAAPIPVTPTIPSTTPAASNGTSATTPDPDTGFGTWSGKQE